MYSLRCVLGSKLLTKLLALVGSLHKAGTDDQVPSMVDDHAVARPLVHGQELAPPGDRVLVVDKIPTVGYYFQVLSRKAVIACGSALLGAVTQLAIPGCKALSASLGRKKLYGLRVRATVGCIRSRAETAHGHRQQADGALSAASLSHQQNDGSGATRPKTAPK